MVTIDYLCIPCRYLLPLLWVKVRGTCKTSEVISQVYDIPHIWNLKINDTNELTYKTERFTDLEKELTVARGKWGEGIATEFGMDMHTLLYLKCETNKDLLYSTGNSAPCHVAARMGGEFGREGPVYKYG